MPEDNTSKIVKRELERVTCKKWCFLPIQPLDLFKYLFTITFLWWTISASNWAAHWGKWAEVLSVSVIGEKNRRTSDFQFSLLYFSILNCVWNPSFLLILEMRASIQFEIAQPDVSTSTTASVGMKMDRMKLEPNSSSPHKLGTTPGGLKRVLYDTIIHYCARKPKTSY